MKLRSVVLVVAMALLALPAMSMAVDDIQPTVYSSTNWQSGYPAANICDGSQTTEAISGATTATVVLDLGSAVAVRNIGLNGRRLDSGNSITAITVEVYDNDDPCTGSLQQVGAWDGYGTFLMNRGRIIEFSSEVTKQYLIVTFTASTSSGTQVAEIRANADVVITDADTVTDTSYPMGNMTFNASTWGRFVGGEDYAGWCILDTGTHTAEVWGLTLTAPTAYTNMMPASGSILASDDPTSFDPCTDVVATFSGLPSPAGQSQTIPFNGGATTKRYLKLIWTSLGDAYMQFRCADMAVEDGVYVPESSGWNSSYPAANMFDGSETTCGVSSATTAVQVMDLGTAQAVWNIALSGRHITDTMNITSITVEAWDNDDPRTGTLETLGTWDGYGSWAYNRGHVIPFTSEVTKRYLKLTFVSPVGGTQLAEIRANVDLMIADADTVVYNGYAIAQMTYNTATWGRFTGAEDYDGWCILDTGTHTAEMWGLTLTAGAAYTNMMPASGSILASDDPTSFDPCTDVVATFSGLPSPAGQSQTIPFNGGATTKRYLKLIWTSLGDNYLQFRCADMAIEDGPYVPESSGWSDSYPPANLFDGLETTFAISSLTTAVHVMDLGTAQAVWNIGLSGRHISDSMSITSITVEAWDNDDPRTGTLETLGEWDGYGSWVYNRGHIVSFANEVTKRYLKLTFVAPVSNGTQLAEIRTNVDLMIADADAVAYYTGYAISQMTYNPATWGRFVGVQDYDGWCLLDTGNHVEPLSSLSLTAVATYTNMLVGTGMVFASDDPSNFDNDPNLAVLTFIGATSIPGETFGFSFNRPVTERYLKLVWTHLGDDYMQFRCADMAVSSDAVRYPASGGEIFAMACDRINDHNLPNLFQLIEGPGDGSLFIGMDTQSVKSIWEARITNRLDVASIKSLGMTRIWVAPDEDDPSFDYAMASSYTSLVYEGDFFPSTTNRGYVRNADVTDVSRRYVMFEVLKSIIDETMLAGDHYQVADFDYVGDDLVACSDVTKYGLNLDADIDADCYVGIGDIQVLASQWLGCTDPLDAACQAVEVSPSYTILPATITVDGDLSEWTDIEWMQLDKVYAGNPLDVASAKVALKWNAATDKIYAAVVVDDGDHVFYNIPENWNTSDRLEIYCQGDPNGGLHYGAGGEGYFDKAQQYATGPGETTGYTWMTWAEGTSTAVTPALGLESVAVVNGSVITYELGVPVFDWYGGLSGAVTVTTALDEWDEVGFDIIADTLWTPAGFGMLAENMMTGKWDDAGQFQKFMLLSAAMDPYCGDWGYLEADIDKDCEVGLSDFAEIAAQWLMCNDPAELAGDCVSNW